MRTAWNLAIRVSLLAASACSRPVSHIRESDEPIVNKALDDYGKGKISRTDLLKTYDVVIVYLPNMACVGFNLRGGMAGGDETFCYDKVGRKVVSYRNGD